MQRSLALLLLVACTGEPEPSPVAEPVVAPAPEPVVAPEPGSAVLDAVVAFEAPATPAGSPVLEASYAAVLEALRKAEAVEDRVARVAALRAKAMSDVPAEDGSSLGLREAYDGAVADALEAFSLAYAGEILASDAPDETKAEHIELIEAALLQSWDWDLTRRDVVQAKLMMALRSAG